MNSQRDKLPADLIHAHVARLIEHCTGIAEFMIDLNPVQALMFFRLN